VNCKIISAQKIRHERFKNVQDRKRKRTIIETTSIDIFQQVVEEMKFKHSTLPPHVFENCFLLDGTFVLYLIDRFQSHDKLSHLYPFERSDESNLFECQSPKFMEKIRMQFIEPRIKCLLISICCNSNLNNLSYSKLNFEDFDTKMKLAQL